MKFRTEIRPVKAGFRLNPERPVILLGSCFAENIARKMRLSLWDASNPPGTLYNPLSIEKALRLLIFSKNPEKDFLSTVFRAGRLNHSWLFDSKASSEYIDDSLQRLSAMREELLIKLKDADALFVTFGTAWCYFLAGNPDFVVANCHKQPSALFLRRRLSTGEIVRTWERLAADLRDRFPGLRIIFTVSPVRHIKDGFEGNARSKAVLLLAVEEICTDLDFCSYFPAFELVNDDLRDYRFYASDLVHPSDEAADYIWDFFKASYLDDSSTELLKTGEKIVKARLHRPLLPTFCRRSETTEREEKKRMENIAAEHIAFTESHPGMLPFDYPFEKDV